MALSNDCIKYRVQYLSVIAATLGLVSDEMQRAWLSPGLEKLRKPDSPLPLTEDESFWIRQWYIIGNITAVCFSFVIFKKRSRKLSIILAGLPILIGWIGNWAATSMTTLCVARFIGGLGTTTVYVAVPMYIGEIADPKIRGVLGVFIIMASCLGLVAIYAITPFFPLPVSYLVGLSFVIGQMVFISMAPESPYYLLSVQRETEARQVLKRLKRPQTVVDDIKMLVSTQKQDQSKFYDLFTVQSNRKALFILIMLTASQMMSGVLVIDTNIHRIFRAVEGSISEEWSAIIYGLMMLFSCLLSLVITDRYGRRTLMMASCIATALVLIVQGVFFYLKENHAAVDSTLLSWLSIANIVTFVLVYRFGLGAIPYVMVSELFPENVKALGIACVSLTYSVTFLISNTIFEFAKNTYGMYSPFWVFGCFSVMAAIFTFIFLPETKGKTLEEIQYILMNKKYNVEHMKEYNKNEQHS